MGHASAGPVDYFAPELHGLRDLYCNLMHEIRNRTNFIQGILEDRYKLPKSFAPELCYLQLRMICELIALASLAAHGDILATLSSNAAQTYKADVIIKALAELHPDFYPKPVRSFPASKVGQPVVGQFSTSVLEQPVPTSSSFLTKEKLLKLYSKECGNALHRGSFRKIQDPKTTDFTGIRKAQSEIRNLLITHRITLRDDRYELWVTMQDPKDDRPHARFMTRFKTST